MKTEDLEEIMAEIEKRKGKKEKNRFSKKSGAGCDCAKCASYSISDIRKSLIAVGFLLNWHKMGVGLVVGKILCKNHFVFLRFSCIIVSV